MLRRDAKTFPILPRTNAWTHEMSEAKTNAGKELYRKLRTCSCARLWEKEVPRFDRATTAERVQSVGLIRAVGVVFSESGTARQKEEVRKWLRGLLQDPEEKIRRYAMTALPKLGADPRNEAELLTLLNATSAERELKFLGRTLDKIGGAATLAALEEKQSGGLQQTKRKVRATVARREEPGGLRLDAPLSLSGVRMNLRCRRGLEEIVREELQADGKFRVLEVGSGLVTIGSSRPFTLAEVFRLRCFSTLGFPLGEVSASNGLDEIADVMTSAQARAILTTLTDGAIRYRLEFVEEGHRRGAVRLLANKAYARCPQILNDARESLWTVAIHPTADGSLVELMPRLRPDPRFTYRRADVPAASHPPLAACLARLAEPMREGIVWDPFCGSGLELIEVALLGGIRTVFASDRSADAVEVARANFSAAKIPDVQASFTTADLRDHARIAGLSAGTVSLIVTNPPMGKRVPVPNLRALIEDLLAIATKVLRPGGRLIFPNPLSVHNRHRELSLESRRLIDLGGFDCQLEVYRKAAR
ncbi:MAG TPA: methyltransferase [Chthoniobacteraceae bacterium]|jgi:23S rRNA G2445 N2-methylase RlmL